MADFMQQPGDGHISELLLAVLKMPAIAILMYAFEVSVLPVFLLNAEAFYLGDHKLSLISRCLSSHSYSFHPFTFYHHFLILSLAFYIRLVPYQ